MENLIQPQLSEQPPQQPVVPPSIPTKSKLPVLVIAAFIFLIIVSGGAYYVKSKSLITNQKACPAIARICKDDATAKQGPNCSQTCPEDSVSLVPTEVINIDSQDNPDLGLAGYSSGSLKAGNQEIQIRLLAPDRKKIILSSFPCEASRVTAVEGTYKIIALLNVDGPVIDRYSLGKLDFVIDPAGIEQTGSFSKLVTLNNNPTYQAFTLAFRKSCHDTQVYLFGFDDKKQKIVKIPFVKKDGTKTESILIPKGNGIPQVDSSGNIISSSYNDKTKLRDKTRYEFNLKKFDFEEIESYSQAE